MSTKAPVRRVQFQFDDALPHQSKAINSTVALFEGLPKRHQGLYANSASYLLDPRNQKIPLGTRLLQNVQALQLENDIFTDETLHNGQFGIEMETGTGKTYVYLRTILSLYETYSHSESGGKAHAFKKFLIVVPSVAIRKGVEKTLEQLQDHLKALHNVDIAKHSFVYDSANVGRMKAFVENHDLDICVINSQAFASAKTIIQKELEQGGEILWEKIKDIHPIVIIDEPQKVEGTQSRPSKSREQLSELQPLFELKYSATHRQEFPINMLYSLNSHAAYEQQLVKRIRVKTVYGQIPKDQPYIRYVKFNKDLTAEVELFTQTQGGRIKARKHRVENNADLHELSGNLSQYAGHRIAAQPHKEAPLRIQTNQGEVTLDEGATNMEMSQDRSKKIQIRLAIEAHFEKQWELLDAGHDIKALTLFFIDEVAKVRDDEQADGRGEYLRIFDEEYEAYLRKEETQFKLEEYSYLFPDGIATEDVREGYFARDKDNKPAELTTTAAGVIRDNAANRERLERGISLILEKKDELITFKEPLAFIFSHSALREGWDNPNVFTLCTLRKSNSDIAKKQEIGRGLRLPVDIKGKRITNEKLNVLTVIANDHYDHFADTLQKDFNEEMGFNREEVTQTLLQKALVDAGIPTNKIKPDLVNAFRQELKRKGIITENNLLTKDAAEEIADIDFAHDTLDEHATKLKESFNKLMKQKGSRKVKVENGDVEPIENAICKYVEEGEFKRLLDTLTKHLTQRTLYTFDLDTDDFISRCISKTNEYFAGEKLELLTTIETGNVSFDNSGKVVTDSPEVDEDASEYSRMPDEFRKTDLQIVDHIMYHTMMPRLAILEILRGFGNRELLNSQDILEEYTKLLNNELTLAKASGLKGYEVVKDYQLDAAKILEADVIDEELFAQQIKRVYESDAAKKKAVLAYYNMDSDGEYDFAKELDKDAKVQLFTKLKKGGFIIDTPHGNYSPDWAIVYQKEDGHLKLFFVVETKWDKDEQHLTSVERDKIKCGKLHFAAVSDVIKFDWANSYEDFERKFLRAITA